MRRFAGKVLTFTMLAIAILMTALTAGAKGVGDGKHGSLYAWVELGSGGQIIARAITPSADCPYIKFDGTVQQMLLRAGAATIPNRTNTAGLTTPTAFPVTTCEYTIPQGTHLASVSATAPENSADSIPLPLPKDHPHRIVILGDTGCRLAIGNPWQACYDPQEWPLATIAQTAARFSPDLVLHVGDYHYRENQCPPDIAGCAGSPFGYGWDVWEADLFQPAAPLLAVAPWIVVRGNHEECARGGQGWFRFLDTRPYASDHTCNLPANDNTANFNDPYAVPVGDDAQIIVFDSSKAAKTALKSTDYAFGKYQSELNQVAALAAAKPNAFSIWTNHHPLLAFSPVAGTVPTGGNPALLSVMYATYGTKYFPPGIGMALHGHTHIFEALNFSTDHPPTIMAGHGGDNLDLNLPDPFPADLHPDSVINQSAVDVEEIADTSTFGFVVADREADGSKWTFREYTRDGQLLTTCTFDGSKMSCSKTGFLF